MLLKAFESAQLKTTYLSKPRSNCVLAYVPVREPALFTAQMGDEILGRLGRKKDKISKSASEISAVSTTSVMYTSAVMLSLFQTVVLEKQFPDKVNRELRTNSNSEPFAMGVRS